MFPLWPAFLGALLLGALVPTAGQAGSSTAASSTSAVVAEPPQEELTEQMMANQLRRRHPYMVSLRNRDGFHYCTGVVVEKDRVLTAAHCLDTRVSAAVVAKPHLVVGALRTDSDPSRDNETEVRETKKVFVHPKWSGSSSDGYDIAIVVLNETLMVGEGNDAEPWPFIRTPYPGFDGKSHQSLTLTAYGRISEASGNSPFLTKAQMEYIPREECNQPDRRNGTVSHTQLCAGDTVSKPCLGDGGSPLFQEYKGGAGGNPQFRDLLFGVVSKLNIPCTAPDPVIFTSFISEDIQKWFEEFVRAP